MNTMGKVCMTVLCALTLVFAGGCEETPLSLLLPAHEGEQVQSPPQSEEETPAPTPTPTPTPTPPTQENQTDSGEETEEEQEEPPVSPPQEQEKITVRFIFFDESSVTKEFDKGAVVTLEDVPDFTGDTRYRYGWDLDGVPLVEDVDYRQTRYEPVSSASEFMSMQAEENYFLEEDITLSKFSTLPAFNGVIEGNGKTLSLTVCGQTKTLFEEFNGTLQNITVNAIFQGKTVADITTAQSCALFNKITGNATFKNCRFTVAFTASATEKNPSAGLALDLQNASFENCSLETKADGLEYIYAVCKRKSSSVTLAGLTVIKNGLEDYGE